MSGDALKGDLSGTARRGGLCGVCNHSFDSGCQSVHKGTQRRIAVLHKPNRRLRAGATVTHRAKLIFRYDGGREERLREVIAPGFLHF